MSLHADLLHADLLHYTLQREALLRKDEAAQAALRARTDARVLAMYGDALSLLGASPYQAMTALSASQREHAVFLGLYDGIPTFAVRLDEPDSAGFSTADFGDLRQHAASLSSTDLLIACQAKALLHWHREHGFCAGCGKPTVMQEAGHSRHCEYCQRNHFPRTDPAIIVAIAHGDKLLFGRQASWPAGRYGMIAGFVEPGESLEQAVAREVMEETGLRITGVPRYAFSQPWPYPASLMVAYFANSEADVLELKDHELEHAQWLSRDELITAIKRGEMKLPTRASVAYALVNVWFEQDGRSLATELGY
ncbi:MAG: NAD(+) diphosphatase [Permianibacter sp.]